LFYNFLIIIMKIKQTLSLLTLLLCATFVSAQTAISSTASGNWNSPATWVGGVVPTAIDSVSIAGTHTVSVTANASCAAVTLLGGATATTLNINSGVTLTVSRYATINRSTANSITNVLNVGAGTLTAAAVDLKGNTANPTRITRLNISTGAVNLVGNTSAGIDGSVLAIGAPSEVVFSGNGTLNLAKNFMSGANSGTFTAGTGTIANNSTATMIFGGYTYNNLTVAGTGSVQFLGNTVINGTFNNTANNLNIKIRNNLTVGGTFNAGTGIYTFESTSPSTNPATSLALTGNITISRVEIDTNVTLTLPIGSTLNSTGTFNNYGIFVNNGTLTKTAGTYRGNGTFSGATYINNSTVAPGDSVACLTFSNGYDNGTGILDIDLTGTTACSQNDQLIVTGTAKASGYVRVDLGSLTPSVGTKYTIVSGASAYIGSFDSVVVNSRKYEMTYANGELTVTKIVTDLYPFTSVKTGNWNDPSVWAGGVAPSAADSVVIAAGHTITVTAAASANVVSIEGGTTNTTLALNGGTSLTVSKSVIINRPTADGIGSILNVGVGTLTAAAVDLKGNSTNPLRGTILSISTGTVNLVGNTAAGIDGSVLAAGAGSGVVFTANGTLNFTKNFMSGANPGTLSAGTGTIAANGTLLMIFGGYTYTNITVAGSNTVQFIGNPIIGGTFNNTANNLNVKIRGNLTANGVFNAGTGTYTFESTSPNTNPTTALTLTGNITLPRIEIDTNTTLTLASGSTLTNVGTLTNNGTLVSLGTLLKTAGMYTGNGTFSGKTYGNTTTVAPGDSIACMTFLNGYNNGLGILDLDISGATACSLHDQLIVTGTANVGGTLNVDLGSYSPAVGQKFTIISGASSYTGSFSNINVFPKKLEFTYANGELTVSKLITDLYPFSSVKTGNWNDPSVWAGGVVPSAADSTVITVGHAVTITAAANCSALNIEGGTANTTLTINSGTSLTVNKSVIINRPTVDAIASTLNIGAGTLTAAAVDLKGNSTNPLRGTILSISTGTVYLIGNTAAGIDGSVLAAGTGSGVAFTGNGTLIFAKNFMSGNNPGTLSAGTGTIVANGTAIMVFGGYTYNNITVAGTGSVQFIGNTVINGAFTNTANNLAVKIRGDLTANSTFNAGTGTYTFESSSPNTNPTTNLTIRGNFTLNRVEIDTNLTLSLPNNSTLTNAGIFTNYGIVINNGTFSKTAGQYRGNGTFSGKTYVNSATVAPGDSLSCMTFLNGYDNGTGVLDLDISGTTACTQHDQLVVTGTAKVSGALRVDLGNLTPSVGQRFTIISGATSYTGSFDSIVVSPRRFVMTYANGVLTVSAPNAIKPIDLDPNGLIIKNTLVKDNLTLITPDTKMTPLSIYNMSGHVLLYLKVQGEQLIPIGHLPSGLYIVRTEMGHVRRFVKE
jgi:hypothetical protein